MKFCPRCKTEKTISEFYKRASARDGLAYVCKICFYSPGERTRAERNDQEIAGLRFGLLVAIERNGHDESGRVMWLCQCDCGNKTTVEGSALRRRRKSCGCRHGPGPNPGFLVLFSRYKVGAKRRGYEWILTKEEAKILFVSKCFYCGEPPSRTITQTRDTFYYNGIDRQDPSLGYSPDNCVPCCTRCNYFKSAMPIEEFYQTVSSIYCNLVKNGIIKTV